MYQIEFGLNCFLGKHGETTSFEYLLIFCLKKISDDLILKFLSYFYPHALAPIFEKFQVLESQLPVCKSCFPLQNGGNFFQVYVVTLIFEMLNFDLFYTPQT